MFLKDRFERFVSLRTLFTSDAKSQGSIQLEGLSNSTWRSFCFLAAIAAALCSRRACPTVS